MKGVPVPSKWHNISPPSLASWPQSPYHLYHSLPLIDAKFYIWTISSSAHAVYLSRFTGQGTLLADSFVITTARNYHHNMCNGRSTRPTVTNFQRWRFPWVRLSLCCNQSPLICYIPSIPLHLLSSILCTKSVAALVCRADTCGRVEPQPTYLILFYHI